MNAQFDFDKYKPDLVMSHSFPHTSHIVASRINRNRVPWIASFSDLWTDSHFYPYSRFRKERESYLEEETLKSAKCFITTSQTLTDVLARRYYQHAFTILNSYPDADPQPLTKDFTLTYTGNFYAGKYDLEVFCWALANYKYRFPKLKVRIYGQPYPFLVRMVKHYHLEDIVAFHSAVSHYGALKVQRESQVLLHFAWNDPKYQGIYSAKLFEYLGARRPIIAFGGADKAVGELLKQTSAGVWTPTPADFSHVLSGMHQEYMDSGSVQYYGNESEISEYSVEKMAQKHAALFDRMIK